MNPNDNIMAQARQALQGAQGGAYNQNGIQSVGGRVGPVGGTVGMDNGQPFGNANINGQQIGTFGPQGPANQQPPNMGGLPVPPLNIAMNFAKMAAGMNPHVLGTLIWRALQQHGQSMGGVGSGFSVPGAISGAMKAQQGYNDPNNTSGNYSGAQALMNESVGLPIAAIKGGLGQ